MEVTNCHMSNYIERDKRPLRRRLITSGLNSVKRAQNLQTGITKALTVKHMGLESHDS